MAIADLFTSGHQEGPDAGQTDRIIAHARRQTLGDMLRRTALRLPHKLALR